MQVTIHGPNLNDQTQGSFHVHAAECRDNAREERVNGSVWPSTIDAASVLDVVEFIYADVMAENPGTPIDLYVADFHFAPCCSELPS